MNELIDIRRLVGLVLVTFGGGLVANPLWLGSVTIYPGTGWGFLPLFHAVFAALGLVTVGAGLLAIRVPRRPPTNRQLVGLSAGTIIVVPLLARLVASVVGTGGPAIADYEYRQAFVAALVAATFVTGCAVTMRRRSALLIALAAPVFPLVPVLYQWRSGAVLEPVLELHFLLTGGPVLGIEYLGPTLFLAAFVLGLWTGWPSPVTAESSPSADSRGDLQ